MDRDTKFFEDSFNAIESYNENLSFMPYDGMDVLDRIKNMRNMHPDVFGADEAFEKYRDALYSHYKNRPNLRVVAVKKLIISLQKAVDDYESFSSGEENGS